MVVVEALAFFCALHTDEGKSALQTKMMRNLLTVQLDFASCVDFRLSLTILESFIRCDQDEIQREYADAPLKFLLMVCEKDCKDEESSRRLLNLLPFFLEYATKYRHDPKRIIETLSATYKCVCRRNCGIPVHGDYMKCVCDVIRIDSDFTWSAATEEITMMLDSVLGYIGHPLFVLRAQAVGCLQKLLSFGNFAYKWKERIFIKMEETMLELLNVNQESSSDAQRY